MGGNSDSAEPLTILSLCDLLQNMLIENGMRDLPVMVTKYEDDYSWVESVYLDWFNVVGEAVVIG